MPQSTCNFLARFSRLLPVLSPIIDPVPPGYDPPSPQTESETQLPLSTKPPTPPNTHPHSIPTHSLTEVRLDDHLRNSLSTQRLAAYKSLALDTSKRIEYGGDQQENGRSDQTGGHCGKAGPLDGAHAKVDESAHIVGLEFANESVKLGRRRADSEEERYLNEDYDECAYSIDS